MKKFIEFDRKRIIEKLKSLNPNENPAWGVMTPQHMVEHLIIIYKISNGSIKQDLYIDEDQIPVRLKFLRGQEELAKNIKIKNLPVGKPLPLRMENMSAAIEKLDKEIKRFKTSFEENPDLEIVHPMFGSLRYEDWVQFHRKHTTHHFKQFGLID